MPAPSLPSRTLVAGPVRLTLADGELRYLHIGAEEVVRRLYFCVRFHDKWDTALNEVTRCTVAEQAGGFTVDLAARAVTGPVNYGWTARITGAADGTLTFAVQGAALGPCTQIRRTGLQLLLGAGAVIGQPFVMTRPDGTSLRQELQTRLDPVVLPMQFRQLAYTTRGGLQASAEFAGTTFGYEDQRNFNDSSFKFFSAHAHSYPTLERGAAAEASVTLRFRPASAPPGAARPDASRADEPALSARVGSMTGGARLPRVSEAGARTPDSLFMALNRNRPAQADSRLHTWGFTPAVNLYDDDTFMENVPAVLDQIRTARVFTNPHGFDVGCRIDPVHFESLHPRPARDPRNHTAFGSAWLVAFMKYAALGAAHEVAVRLGPGPVDAIRDALAARAGRAVRLIAVTAPTRAPVEAFGVVDDSLRTELWFANVSSQPVRLPVTGVSPGRYTLRRVHASAAWDQTAPLVVADEGGTVVTLAPHEVQVLTPE